MVNRFRIIKDTLRYSASTLVAQGIGLISGLWIARMLQPSDFGIWNAVSLVLVYGAYVDLGVLSAMGRDLPFHYGKEEAAKAAVLEGAARWATLAGAMLAATVVLIASFLLDAPPMIRVGLRLMAFLLILQQVYTYHRTVLRARNQFGELSGQQILQAVLTAGFALSGAFFLGLLGRMLGAVLAHVGILAYAVYRHPWGPVPALSRSVLVSLMRIGIPMTISGAIISMVTTIDRLMVIHFLGAVQLGYFGLALLLTSLVSLVPSMASQVLYPRIMYVFGQSGRDVIALRPFVLTPPLVLARLLPVVIGPLFIGLPLVITLFLPAYMPGIAAMRIVLVGIFFLSVLGLTDYFLVATGKLKQYVLFGGITLALNFIFDYISLRLGYGIEGIAFSGTPLTYFFYSCLIIGYALSHYTRDVGDWCRYFAKIWLPFIYMLVVLALTDVTVRRWMPSSTNVAIILSGAAQIAAYLVCILPLVIMAAREMKLELSLASLAQVRSGLSAPQ